MKKIWFLLLVSIGTVVLTGCLRDTSEIIDDCVLPEDCAVDLEQDLEWLVLTAFGTEPFWDIEISWWIATFSSPMYDTDIETPVTIWKEGENYYFSGEELEGEFIKEDCIDGGKGDVHYYTVWIAKFRDYYYEGCGDGAEGIKMSDEEYAQTLGINTPDLSNFAEYLKTCERDIVSLLDSTATEVSYARFDELHVGNSYNILGSVMYQLNDTFYQKDTSCIFQLGDVQENDKGEAEYFWRGDITSKSAEEETCLNSLSHNTQEEIDAQTVRSVVCHETSYGEKVVTGYVYSQFFPELWIKITTPAGGEALLKNKEKPVVLLNGKKIVYGDEYLQVYEKKPTESLTSIIAAKHLNNWCKAFEFPYFLQERIAEPEPQTMIYEIIDESGMIPGECIPDDEDTPGKNWYNPVRYFEHPNKDKYYKLVFTDGCAPGPCSMFGTIEFL